MFHVCYFKIDRIHTFNKENFKKTFKSRNQNYQNINEKKIVDKFIKFNFKKFFKL